MAENIVVVPAVGSLQAYDPSQVDWDVYECSLINYFAANKIDENDRKRAILLNAVGLQILQNLRDLCSPDKPESKTFDALIEILRNHFGPKITMSAQRMKFSKRVQAEGESVDQYILDLRKLTLGCNFAANLDERLRDQLIIGVRSDGARKILMKKEQK